MANYNAYSRTNYFKVTDVEKLKMLLAQTSGDVEVWEEDGKVAFGAYDKLTSYYDEKNDVDMEIFPELQQLLPEGEVVVIQEVGHEKLRYLVGEAYIITKDTVEVINLDTFITAKVNEFFPGKEIKMEY
jgi:hypothetical protein